jgi:tungstate transport system substrate-binding protein
MDKRNIIKTLAVFLVCSLVLISAGCGAKTNSPATTASPIVKNVILATTTSTQDSGLLDMLIPIFEQKTGYKIKTIAVGSGQAIAMGEKGEADVLLTHAPDAERKIAAGGTVINRTLVMHNDFIIIGPVQDSVKIKGKNATDALAAIAKAQAVFISRGDKSGTDQLEKKLWKQIELTPKGGWYQESGTGMGQTLTIANEKNGYIITDRATFLAQKKSLSLDILVEGDAKLLNIYHVMLVNPDKFAKVNKDGAKAFSDFLLASETQTLIANFGKDKFGQPLFFADGGKTEKDFGI